MNQLSLNLEQELVSRLKSELVDLLGAGQPSASEVVHAVEQRAGAKARWELRGAITSLIEDAAITRSNREYLSWLIKSGELDKALRGTEVPDHDARSSIDSLVAKSRAYRQSKQFQEMIDFMGRFREYAPFNNMLVRLQNPSCAFFATESHWAKRFGGSLKEDAQPMIILAPMRPVLLVYDLDQIDGVILPDELDEFAVFVGEWDAKRLLRLVENADKRDRIRVNFKKLSKTMAGFATVMPGRASWKRRIVVHEDLDGPSRFGVLCHELAHIYLGHLGSDADHWWPARTNLSRHAVEVEAEAVAHLVTSRLGMTGASASYVSRHMPDDNVPTGVSLEFIAKTASRIEEMCRSRLPVRKAAKPQAKASKQKSTKIGKQEHSRSGVGSQIR